MSTYALGLVTEFHPYRGTKHLVACQLAEFANTDGLVSETIEQMAKRATISARQFRRILREMEADGWIECIERSPGGQGVGSQYRLNQDWLKLPLGWQARRSAALTESNNPDITRTLPGQDVRVEPGHYPVRMSGLLVEKAPDLEATPSLFKTIPPYIPPFSNIAASGSAVPSATAADESEDMRLARWMFERVLAVHPAHRQPAWKRWLRDIGVMRRQGHSRRAIAELFAWANADEFWALNIRSPKKLWQHWDTLAMKRKRQAETRPAAPATVDPKCERCHERAWSHQQGKGGPRLCSACAAELEAAA